MLNVVINGDLEVSKTLRECSHVFKIYLDLTRKVKKKIKKNYPNHVPTYSASIHECVWHYFGEIIFAAEHMLE